MIHGRTFECLHVVLQLESPLHVPADMLLNPLQ
jgi:hypothetical protein